MKLSSIKIQLIIFLGIFAAYLWAIDKDIAFLSAISVSLISAVFLDSSLTYLKTKRFIITDSSIISGLIIGYVLSSAEPWWIFLIASSLAIGSKHLIRIKNRHLFNPAGLGIFLSTLLLGAVTQWRGAGLWYIIVPIGFYFVWKTRKLEIVAGYFFSFFLLFGVRALIQGASLIDVLKYQNYFFIFIMLIEPMTTPAQGKGKWIFGTAVGISIFVFTMAGIKFDSELASLLLLNIFVPVLNRLK